MQDIKPAFEILHIAAESELSPDEIIRTLLATAAAILMQYSTKEAAAAYLHEVADVILTDMDEPLH